MNEQLKGLATLVEECRKAQKTYFKSLYKADRDDLLRDSKRLERLVDQAVNKILHPTTGELFPGQGGGRKQIDP